MLIKYLSLSLIVIFICCINSGNASDIRTFSSAGANNLFSNAANWDGGITTPTTNDDLIITVGETMEVNVNFSCKTLRINAGASFNCNGGILTITEGIYDENGVKKIDIKSSLQISSSIKLAEPVATSGSFTDIRDGNSYNWVKIGDQAWMSENLKYLPAVVGPGIYSTSDPYYYVYDYYGTVVTEAKATLNYATYGVLYNWTAAMNSATSSASNPSGVQGVCPADWHLPSNAEWIILSTFLGGEGTAGGTMKETGNTHWDSPNTGATNSSGFTGLPGGRRNWDSSFSRDSDYGIWWSSTEGSPNSYAYWRSLSYDSGALGYSNGLKYEGYSVRCVRD